MRRAIATAALVAAAFTWWPAHAATNAHAALSPPPTAAAKSSEGVVNLNDASEAQLTLLPGIGPAKARAIVEHRRVHPFHRADELTKVKGIGRKTFANLRSYITTVGPTTLQNEVKLRR